MITLSPNTAEAYRLLHEGSLALGDVEMNGISVDVDYCRDEQRKAGMKLREIESSIFKMAEGKQWRKKYGNEASIGSTNQLSTVLFKLCEYKQVKGTSTDASVLAEIGTSFTDAIVQHRKIQQASGTFLQNIVRQTGEDGILHPSFALNTATTYRSSSMDPNFQNIPIRDPVIGKLIRRAFKARPGRQLLELDYSGAEVACGTCYHKDPAMVAYITDSAKDMHRDMAMECYKLSKSEVTKNIRYCGKNMFVFPQFYGDYYKMCAKSLWKAVGSMKLETTSGIPLKAHLKKQGLGTYRLFENHLEDVEDDFWNERFPVYTNWKKKLYNKYLKTGCVHTLTGFTVQGNMRKNQVINFPVQGSAFHWLLWSLIQLNRELKRRGMVSRIVGQIHDSLILDCDPRETDEVVRLAREIMTKRILKHFPWIIVPLTVDAELAPVGGTWHDKEDYAG